MLLSRTLSFGRETRAHFLGHGDLQESAHSGLSRSETRVHGPLVGAQAKALDFEIISCPVKGDRDLLSTQSCVAERSTAPDSS